MKFKHLGQRVVSLFLFQCFMAGIMPISSNSSPPKIGDKKSENGKTNIYDNLFGWVESIGLSGAVGDNFDHGMLGNKVGNICNCVKGHI